MDSKIETRLKAYQSRENIELFFDIIYKLVNDLGITKDDTRFCLNVRNASNKQRISVTINSRLIGGIRNDKNKDFILFMLYVEDAQNLKKQGIDLKSDFTDFKNAKELDNTQTYSLSIDEITVYEQEIYPKWLKCCADYLPTQSTSQYRKHHLPELFELVIDENYRSKELNRILNYNKMEFIKEEELDYYHQITMNDNVYKKNDLSSQEKGKIIKATIFDKTNYWATLLSEKNPEFIYRPDNVWQMSGYIKGYSWVRFNLVEHKNFKIFFTIGISGENKNLVIKLDCQRANTDKLEDDFIARFDNLKNSLGVTDLKIETTELQKYNWESLVNKTLNYFSINLRSYNKLIEEIYNVKSNKTILITHPLNQIFYGSPGTGKTYHTINYALSIIENKSIKELEKEERSSLKSRYDEYVKTDRIVFTTFHQSMSYEDFIEGIKPIEPKEEGGNISYRVINGIFKEICKNATLENKLQIKLDDENKELTKEIFEDLYYSFSEKLPEHKVETSDIKLKTQEGYEFQLFRNSADSIVVKAGKMRTNMSVSCNELVNVLFNGKLPVYKSYEQLIIDKILEGRNFETSKVDNSFKPYVLIIDEINRGNVSAIFGELITLIEIDKRIGEKEELYITLPYSKKSFGVPSNLYIIGTMNTADRSVEALDTALRRRFHFTEMPPNYDLQKLKEPIFETITLGNILKTINERIEYLLNRDHTIGHSYFLNVNSITDLNNSFFKNIIPLLQEYFCGDYAKMSLVIGHEFFEKKKLQKDITWAITDNNIEKPEREVWNLKTSMTDEEFKQAINLLLGKKNES